MDRRTFLAGAAAATAAAPATAAERAGSGRTILLRSAWDTINIGDIGHTPGTLAVMERHLPGARVILWPMRIDARVEAMIRRRFPAVEWVRGKPGEPALEAALARSDLVLHNSGMNVDMEVPSWCIARGKRFGYYGQSYFPFFPEGEKGREALRLLSRASFIYTREANTLLTLQGAGLKGPILEFAPDGCFGMDVRDDARGDAFMRAHGLAPRRFITVHLRTQTAKYPGVDLPPLNPLNPTPEQQAQDVARAAKFREIMTAWVRRTGDKVLIAPEQSNHMPHLRRLLLEPLPADVRAKTVDMPYFWNADEAASVFARAHTAVCHEPHSLVIALANGTPVLHTYSEYHSPKCWMFREIGLRDWMLEMDLTSAAEIAAALFAIRDDYGQAQARVASAMAIVRRRQAESMAAIARILNV